eukprot:6200663-Pleurochrysis_carterae.AAC.1
MQREGSIHSRPKAQSNTGGGPKSILCIPSASPLSLSESDIKRWAMRAFQKQMSQNMRGENSQVSVGINVSYEYWVSIKRCHGWQNRTQLGADCVNV